MIRKVQIRGKKYKHYKQHVRHHSEMLVELYGRMIRINIVKDNNRFFRLSKSMVHLLCLPIQHLVQNKISSKILASLHMDICGSQRMIYCSNPYTLYLTLPTH